MAPPASDPCTSVSGSLLLQGQVSCLNQEKYVLSGYRPESHGWMPSLISAFKLHNETLNFWTHALALLYFLVYAYTSFHDWEHDAMHLYPFYGYLLGICMLFGVSSFAHLCSSVSGKWRDVCFMMDYAAICLYGCGAAIVYFAYCRPPIVLSIADNADVFVVTCMVLGLMANLICCLTRLHYTQYSNFIRVIGFAMPFLYGSIPAFSRCLLETQLLGAFQESSNSSSSSDQTLISTNLKLTQHQRDLEHQELSTFTEGYVKHFVYMALAALINVAHVPERWLPGVFDIFGHSHQWFHIFIFMAVREQFGFVLNDLFLNEQKATPSSRPSNTTFGHVINPTYVVVTFSVLVGIQILITVFFSHKIVQQSKKGNSVYTKQHSD